MARPAVLTAEPDIDPSLTTIRGGSGLGDSLYLQSIARHLIEQGKPVEVCTFYPDVFRSLNGRVIVSEFRRQYVDKVAHYVSRKEVKGTDQFEDCCISAGIREPVDMRLDWQPVKGSLVREIKRMPRPVIAVLLPRHPMARKDGFGLDLLPDCRAMQRAIDGLRAGGASTVQVGSGEALHEFSGIDLDLANRTSVSDVLDVASAVDGFLGYCSFFVPLAESLKRPALFVWSRKGLRSKREFIRLVTPEKVLHRETSAHVWDDAADDEIKRAADALFVEARTAAVV